MKTANAYQRYVNITRSGGGTLAKSIRPKLQSHIDHHYDVFAKLSDSPYSRYANHFARSNIGVRHAARLFYRAIVGTTSDRNWRYQLAGGINLMATRHRSSSLLLRRNASDMGWLSSPSLSSSLLEYPIGRFNLPLTPLSFPFRSPVLFLSCISIRFCRNSCLSFSLVCQREEYANNIRSR